MLRRKGSSPRGRGSRLDAGHLTGHRGFIPARTGEPSPNLADACMIRGSSPRGRESPVCRPGAQRGRGFIPARTGEPRSSRSSGGPTRVHPRADGGAGLQVWMPEPSSGSSPRGRGSRLGPDERANLPGFIPAWTGEPPAGSPSCPSARVHPHADGGAPRSQPATAMVSGSSPCGRGSHAVGCRDVLPAGFIPARTGEPCSRHRASPAQWVHPRADGGADETTYRRRLDQGPFPRGRGSPIRRTVRHTVRGFIPARTGEPRSRAGPCRPRRVHPRADGEAATSLNSHPAWQGSSPRGRGSHTGVG